ncbi:EamA-like transporter family protein [Enhydrobacter aerosaccus]|uniref:EamA-like transporter family protein n=1 Tax=Enhydrobacter aerosaccus TaxID=225324 RepID=A0A1T4SQ32_9HYPH|nr:DMT family transporter [Enhydrobacter aerosaccus]SKA30325.1 EamA-like transporter family protein [Enhydrobacter aerosaccus]
MVDATSDTEGSERRRWGLVSGATMALGASVSFAAARAALVGGLQATDLIFARYVVAGLVMLPLLLRFGVRDLAGIGLGRGLVLAVLGGAPFALLQTGGYGFAPLAHGAVIAPATVTIVSTIGAALLLRERLSSNHLAGAAIVLAGIVLIGWDGIAQPAGERAWLGDLLFFLSSVLWAGFTLLLRLWRLSALRATAVVAVLSALATTPAYLLWAGPAHLLALPLGTLIPQGLIQGGVQGALTMYAYGQAVVLLGVSRAVLFPALVPAISVLLGIPIVGEIPGPLQILGLALVTLGLLTTIGLGGLLRPRRRPRRRS